METYLVGIIIAVSACSFGWACAIYRMCCVTEYEEIR